MLENYLSGGFINRKKWVLLNEIIGSKHLLFVTNDEIQRNSLNTTIANELKDQGHAVCIVQTYDSLLNHSHPNIQKRSLRTLSDIPRNSSHDQLMCYLTDNEAEYTIDIINSLNRFTGTIVNIHADNPIEGIDKFYQMVLYPRQSAASEGSEFLTKSLTTACFDYIIGLANNIITVYERKQDFSLGASFDSCFTEIL